jgi:hypothetical protein
MPLTFKLSFEPFDFNHEEFLNDLKRVIQFMMILLFENTKKINKKY